MPTSPLDNKSNPCSAKKYSLKIRVLKNIYFKNSEIQMTITTHAPSISSGSPKF